MVGRRARKIVIHERGSYWCAENLLPTSRPPIGEYGQLAESYQRLKPIHFFLNEFGSQLAPMVTVLPEGVTKLQPTNVDQLRLAARTRDDGGFVFMQTFRTMLKRTI